MGDVGNPWRLPAPSVAPPAPAAPPVTPVPVAGLAQPPCPLEHFTAGESIPVAMSTADLKDGVGSLATAIVAPRSGDIPSGPGTPVVLVPKWMRDSPTFQKLWRAIVIAWSAFWGYVVIVVLVKGGPFALDGPAWLALLKAATYPALASAALVYGIVAKLGDNDPIAKFSLKAAP